MHNDDLNEVLRRMCPQGFAILRFEHGTEMLRMGARELINNPSLARRALGPKGTRALARAVGVLGERYTAIRERLDELAAEEEAAAESAPPTACLRSDLQPTDVDSIKTGGGGG